MSDPFRFFVGIDLSSASHQVCVLDTSGQTLGERAVAHCGADLAAMFDWLAALTQPAAPSSIAVAAEMPQGAMVEAFLERGYAVFSNQPQTTGPFSAIASRWPAPRTTAGMRWFEAHALRTDRYAFRPLALGGSPSAASARTEPRRGGSARGSAPRSQSTLAAATALLPGVADAGSRRR